MYKIYFANKPLLLCAKGDSDAGVLIGSNTTLLIDDIDKTTAATVIKEMQKEEYKGGIVIHADAGELLQLFMKEFQVIQAGGGLVKAEDNQVLLIFRRKVWDLPKGKLEEGEAIEDCAVREVSEETGLKTIRAGKKLITTYHTYHEKGKHILKESHWFLLYAEQGEPLQPQTEEGIEQCVWVRTEDLDEFKKNMHAAVIDVLEAGL